MNNLLFEKLSRFGVLPRSAVRNDSDELRCLLRKKLVRKTSKKGRVFYELTHHSLPLLEEQRQVFLHKAALMSQLVPQTKFYRGLLDNLRFLDEKHSESSAFLFLGDWQLTRPVLASQVELSKLRYYVSQGMA